MLIASQREELSEKSTQINQLTSQLTDLTLSRNQLEKERNEQIENFSLFKDLATEKETNLSKSLHERIKKLEVALAETEEALLVSQSTAKSYV